jgi:hypothetical protein
MISYKNILLASLLLFSCKQDHWVTIKLDDKNCSFDLPFDSYKQDDRVFYIEGLGKINCHEVTINTDKTSDPNAGYEMTCFEYPEFNFYQNDSIIDWFYKGTIQNVLLGYNATIITEEIINYNGNPGRELYFFINDSKIYGFWRSYIIDNKQYSLNVFTRSKDLFNFSTKRFLNSFKMTTTENE